MKKAAFFAVAVLLIAALLAAPLGANAEEDLTFLVVNNNVISFGPAGPPNVPVTRDGWMMAPLSPLTDPDNGLNLHSQWSAKDRRLTVYDGEGIQLTFEVGQGTAFSGEERYTAPIQRFTQFANEWYVPLELISDVFGLYYYGGYETDWGTMVRVFVNPPYDDATFVLGYGKTRIQPVYDDYFAVSIPSPVPSPYVSPNPGVTPAASPIPVSPSPTPVPSPTPPPPPELLSVSVYLTFDGAPNDSTAPLLDYIESENLPALFFLPPESLHNFPQTARRIAERHQAGLLIGETDDPKGAILEGNTLLRETALVKTCLIRTANAPDDSQGYRFWGATQSFGPDAETADIVESVRPLLVKTTEPSVLVLSLPHSDASLAALRALSELFSENESRLNPVNPGEAPPL